jgi:hypothetical protein
MVKKKRVWVGYGSNKEQMRRADSFKGAICLVITSKKEYDWSKKYKVTVEELSPRKKK